MPQEFLASYAVAIDEQGVDQLQRVLEENQELANSVAAAFESASAAIDDFIAHISEDLPSLPFLNNNFFGPNTDGSADSGHVFNIDFTKATRDFNNFIKLADKSLKLNADASGITAAANSALSAVQSQFASTKLKLNVDLGVDGNSGSGTGGVQIIDLANLTGITQAATGGKFTERTQLEVAEDGDTEYVVPVNKDYLAVTYMREAFKDMSANAQSAFLSSLSKDSDVLENKPQLEKASVNINISETGSGRSDRAMSAESGENTAKTVERVENNSTNIVNEYLGVEDDREIDVTAGNPEHEHVEDDSVSNNIQYIQTVIAVDDIMNTVLEIGQELLSEVNDASARIQESMGASDIIYPGDAFDNLGSIMADLPSRIESALSGMPVTNNQVNNNSVDAPITIEVNAAEASPEDVGRSVYNLAERYFLDTVNSVM